MNLLTELDADMLLLVLRQLLLFAHLIGFAIVFGVILREDLALVVSARLDPEALRRTGRIAFLLLAFLWATGLALVALDTGLDLAAILKMPKMMTKIGVVSVLTLNGLLLHWLAFPLMTRPQRRPQAAALVCSVLGAVSLSSWSFAAFVGTARLIAPKVTLADFVELYALTLGLGVAVALVFVRPRIARLIPALARPAPIGPALAAVA